MSSKILYYTGLSDSDCWNKTFILIYNNVASLYKTFKIKDKSLFEGMNVKVFI